MTSPRIFISAAEPSADLHASTLIRAVRSLCPSSQFVGVAGPRMQSEGCECIFDMTMHASMLAAGATHLHHGFQMRQKSRKCFNDNKLDAAVLIDSPFIHGRIAPFANARGIPVLYYIAPQIWAWLTNSRIGWVQNRVTKVACILPFEEAFFRSYGVDACYVGHPLFEALRSRTVDQDFVSRLRGLKGLLLSVFPGSRRHVVERNLPDQLNVISVLRKEFPDLRVAISVSNQRVQPLIYELVQELDSPVELYENRNGELLTASDLALVVSGTITLEAAYYHTPMVVMYRISPLEYYSFGWWVVNTPFISLPNILGGRQVVPEYVAHYDTTSRVIESAWQLLKNPQRRRAQSAELANVVKPFLNTIASETTAKLLLDLIEEHQR